MVVTAILAATAAVATGVGLNEQRKAAYQGRLQVETQQRAQRLQVKRQRRAAIRANILATARSRAAAQAAGTSQSSGLAGAVASGQSQLGSEFGFGSQLSGLNAQATEFGLRKSEGMAKSQIAFQTAGLAMSAFGSMGGYQQVSKGIDKVRNSGGVSQSSKSIPVPDFGGINTPGLY